MTKTEHNKIMDNFMKNYYEAKGEKESKDERKSMTISELSRELYKLQCRENLQKLLGIL